MPLTKEDILASQGNPALLDRLAITNPNGMLMAMYGLGSELYVAPRDRRQLRLDMLAVQEDYYRRFHEQIDNCIYKTEKKEDSQYIKKLKENPFPMIRDNIGEPPAYAKYSNVLYKRYTHPDFPDDADTVTPWESDILVMSENRNRLSSHSCYLPVGDGKGGFRFETLRECLLDWCQMIHPAHGQAGFCVVLEPGSISGEPHTYATLQRHPGLNLIQTVNFSMETENVFNRIKCINWLTVLGDEVLDELGGLDAAKEALEPACTLYPYPGGVVIQAGPVPQLGDIATGFVPERYRKVAHFTKPVRFENYQREGLFRVFNPFDEKEETLKWISRFD